MDIDTVAGLAGTGPWYAVLAWSDGRVVTDPDDIDNIDEPDDCYIQIVRGDARPRDDGDGSLRLPGSYPSGDNLLAFDGEDLDSCDELLERWQQVQAMVDGLNRAATGSPQRAQEPGPVVCGCGTAPDAAPGFTGGCSPSCMLPEPAADPPSVAADAPSETVRAVLDAWRSAGYTSDVPAPLAVIAEAAVRAAYPLIAAAVLRRYADRHHAHPGGPVDLVQTLTIREAGGAVIDYDACRSCSARLDEFGQCTGERPRLLLAAQRIAAGEPDPADPPRPGTEWTGIAWQPEGED